MADIPGNELTMGEFLGHLETLVVRIERVFGFAPCARCGVIKQEHDRLSCSKEILNAMGPIHSYRLAGSEMDRLNQDFPTPGPVNF